MDVHETASKNILLRPVKEQFQYANTSLYPWQKQKVSVVPQYLLLGVFIATAVPLELDQITGGSNANISPYLQWLGVAYLFQLSQDACYVAKSGQTLQHY